MTTELNWNNIEIDHVRPICSVDISKDEELKDAFCGKITQPLLEEVHQQKATKYGFLNYQLQIIIA